MKRIISQTSAIGIALVVLISFRLTAFSLPLTETIYMVPEYNVEIFLRDEVYDTGILSRKDIAGLGFGATDEFSLWLQFEYLSKSAFKPKKADIGDMHLKAKFYIGDYATNQIHLGFLMNFRFPLGKNTYANTDWRNLALGKYEFKLGPFARFDILDAIFIHLNLFYIFREGTNEDFWGGLYINIFKEETWKKVFGLNPVAKNTFLNTNRIKNDYISASMALNTNTLYPFIPYLEIYGSFRVSAAKIDTGNIPIEGAKYNVLLLSVGLRYFFNESIYLGFYTVQNPLQQKQPGYLKAIYGLELSMQL